jgi:hypothetical protein
LQSRFSLPILLVRFAPALEPPLRRWILPALCALAVLPACTYTVVKPTWKADDAALTPLNRVVVLAANGSPGRRKDQNAALAQALAARGVLVSVGSEALPASLYDKNGDGRVDADVDPKAIRDYLRSKGETRALVLSREPVVTQISAPQAVTRDAGTERYDPLSQDFVRVFQTQAPPPVLTRDFPINVVLYDLNSGRPLWKAQTSTQDPEGRADLLQALARAVIAALDQDGLLPAAQQP